MNSDFRNELEMATETKIRFRPQSDKKTEEEPVMNVLACILQDEPFAFDAQRLFSDIVEVGQEITPSLQKHVLPIKAHAFVPESLHTIAHLPSYRHLQTDAQQEKLQSKVRLDFQDMQELYGSKKKYKWVCMLIHDEEIYSKYFYKGKLSAMGKARYVFNAFAQRPVTLATHNLTNRFLWIDKRQPDRNKLKVLGKLLNGDISQALHDDLTRDNWKQMHALFPSLDDFKEDRHKEEAKEEQEQYAKEIAKLQELVNKAYIPSLADALDYCIEEMVYFDDLDTYPSKIYESWFGFYYCLLNFFLFPGCGDKNKIIPYNKFSSHSRLRDQKALYLDPKTFDYDGYSKDRMYDLFHGGNKFANYGFLLEYFQKSGFVQAIPTMKQIQLSLLPRKTLVIDGKKTSAPVLSKDLRKNISAMLGGPYTFGKFSFRSQTDNKETKEPTMDVLAFILSGEPLVFDVPRLFDNLVAIGKETTQSSSLEKLALPIATHTFVSKALLTFTDTSRGSNLADGSGKALRKNALHDLRSLQEFVSAKKKKKSDWACIIMNEHDRFEFDYPFFTVMKLIPQDCARFIAKAVTRQPLTLESHGMSNVLYWMMEHSAGAEQDVLLELLSGKVSDSTRERLTRDNWKYFYELFPSKDTAGFLLEGTFKKWELMKQLEVREKQFIKKADELRDRLNSGFIPTLEDAVALCVDAMPMTYTYWGQLFYCLLQRELFPGSGSPKRLIQCVLPGAYVYEPERKALFLDDKSESKDGKVSKYKSQNYAYLQRYFWDSGFAQAHPAVKETQLFSLPRRTLTVDGKEITAPVLPEGALKNIHAMLGAPFSHLSCSYCQGKDPEFYCSGCNNAFYCSSSCQEADWLLMAHDAQCRKE